MTLDGLEKILHKKFPYRKMNYIRYADDFIITGNTREFLEHEVKPVVIDFLKIRGLELALAKTRITHIDVGFDFLGFNIRKYNRKYLSKPSKESIKSIKRKVKETISQHKQTPQDVLIKILNPIIAGWGNQYKFVVSKEIFAKIDHYIFWILWHWAKRRHPNKNLHWIKKKYYKSEGLRNWIFKKNDAELVGLSYIKIKRHLKILKGANPFDKEQEAYFESKWSKSNKSQSKTIKHKLWVLNNGKCPYCNENIELEDDKELHIKNIMDLRNAPPLKSFTLLHKDCHEELHKRT